MNLNIGKDYRTILQEELDYRISNNPLYSLRAFAKDLGIYSSRLSDVLNGRYGLSREAAIKIATKLKFSEEEVFCFCDMVDSQHARSKVERNLAQSRLQKYKERSEYNELTFEYFKIIKDWYHFAILELTYLKDFKSDCNWIAQKLGIESTVAREAIERLLKIEMLEEVDDCYQAVEDFTATPSDIPSNALKTFHRQLIQKAQDALIKQPVEARDVTAMISAIKKDKLPQAKEMIKKFRRDFDQFVARDEEKDSVYCLGIHFFELTEKEQ